MSTAEASRGPLATLATLVRLPNLFTAPPDVVLGAALVAAAGHAVSPGPVAGLAVASVLLYAAGTTLNDFFEVLVGASLEIVVDCLSIGAPEFYIREPLRRQL